MGQEHAAADLVEILFHRAKRFGRWPALQFRPPGKGLQEVSWADWLNDAHAVTNALRSMAVQPGHRVALCASNCPEWLIVDLGVMMAGAVTVPLRTHASSAARSQMLRATRPRVLFVDGADGLARIQVRPEGLGDIAHLVVFDEPSQPSLGPAPSWLKGRMVRYSDLLIRGRAIMQRGDGIRPETSGRGPG
jgi:long-subunit acyl-CoA synthetase (AMP-forming)